MITLTKSYVLLFTIVILSLIAVSQSEAYGWHRVSSDPPAEFWSDPPHSLRQGSVSLSNLDSIALRFSHVINGTEIRESERGVYPEPVMLGLTGIPFDVFYFYNALTLAENTPDRPNVVFYEINPIIVELMKSPEISMRLAIQSDVFQGLHGENIPARETAIKYYP